MITELLQKSTTKIMIMNELSMGVLSWRSHRTLRVSLESYRFLGLDKLTKQKVIFFQEMSSEDKDIAEEFGYEYIGEKNNIGIAQGYTKLLDIVENENFLFLENDWKLLLDPSSILHDALILLTDGNADLIRLRSRENPGKPLYGMNKDKELSSPSHLLNCLHWQAHPDILFPNHIQRLREWYVTSSKYANWTNNPYIAKTKWLRDVIVPMGNGDIEKSIQRWWEQQDFKVAQGEGLFTHNRLDR